MNASIGISLLGVALLATAACNKPMDTPNEAASTPAPASTSAATPDTSTAASNAPATQPSAAELAGSFSATLPCASCPGIDTTLTLKPDGRYALKEVYQDEKDGRFDSTGSWTLADGRLRLAPASKDDDARVFAVDGKDALTQLDINGERIESTLDYTLKRH